MELNQEKKSLKEQKRFCIYKHTFPNGKVYIGQTCQKVERRWRNGNGYKESALIYNAIQKYGWNNIKHEILFTDISKTEANKLEVFLITKVYKSNNRLFGYNIDKGGALNTMTTGMFWWNNGLVEKRSKFCPGSGWIKGQLDKHHENLCKKRIVNGVVYKSLKDVMNKLHVNKHQAKILCGMIVKKDNRVKIKVNGIEYPSISEAHRQTGISIRQLNKITGTYKLKGYNYNRITKQCISLTINGIWYKSFTRAAKELNVHRWLISKLYKEQGKNINYQFNIKQNKIK